MVVTHSARQCLISKSWYNLKISGKEHRNGVGYWSLTACRILIIAMLVHHWFLIKHRFTLSSPLLLRPLHWYSQDEQPSQAVVVITTFKLQSDHQLTIFIVVYIQHDPRTNIGRAAWNLWYKPIMIQTIESACLCKRTSVGHVSLRQTWWG